MTPTEAALRAALEELLKSTERATRAGLRSAEEGALRQRCAALAAPPHGKDAGEDAEQWRREHQDALEKNWDRLVEIARGERDEALQRRDNFRDHCERLEDQRDALQARLTEAEGLLRRFRTFRGPDIAALAADIAAFLKGTL